MILTKFKTDSFESWMESRESTYDPELVSIGRKLFVIGRNQAYREPSGNAPTDAPDMYGEYRLVVRYPYGNNISPTTALSQSNPKIPTIGLVLKKRHITNNPNITCTIILFVMFTNHCGTLMLNIIKIIFC